VKNKTIFIVGKVSTLQEACEMKSIVKLFVVVRRIKDLASEIKK